MGWICLKGHSQSWVKVGDDRLPRCPEHDEICTWHDGAETGQYVRVEFKITYVVPRKFQRAAEAELCRAVENLALDGEVEPDVTAEPNPDMDEVRRSMEDIGEESITAP